MTVRSELLEGPAIVERMLVEAATSVGDVARTIRDRRLDIVLIAARGTSDHAAVFAQYVLGERNRLPVALAAPSLVSIYGRGPRLTDALVVGISQSGRSPDVVSVIEDGRRQGCPTVAITNDPSSELARAADHVIALGAGPERVVAATKTYLAEVAALAMLSAAISDDDGSAHELRLVPAALRAALESEDEVAGLAASWAGEENCAVLARGFHYATAREWALKLKELARVMADPYSAADFQHGPIALVEPGFPILAVATRGPALAPMAELLARLATAGARLLVLSDDDATRSIGEGIRLPDGIPEWLSPLVAIIPAQLFAYHLTLARGLDPEAPRNLAKVTLTR